MSQSARRFWPSTSQFPPWPDATLSSGIRPANTSSTPSKLDAAQRGIGGPGVSISAGSQAVAGTEHDLNAAAASTAGETQQAEASIKSEIQPVEFASPDPEQIAAPRVATFDQSPALEVEPLVAEVVARNPAVRSAVAAWRAAAARYLQEVALDDPIFGTMLGPASWDSTDVDSAYALEASQKLPWPGKRDLRGNMAHAQANLAFHDVGEERLRIAEAARIAYFEYFLAHRQLAVLKQSHVLLLSFSDIAKSKCESASVEQ